MTSPMSDPDLPHVCEALSKLEMLVVQEIFLTETAWLADVVLPATAFPEKTGSFTNTDRCVQIGRQALQAPGDARQDLWIIGELARRLGLVWDYPHPRDVFNEMRQCMHSIAGITWERLESDGAVVYPCPTEDALEPQATVSMHPADMATLNPKAGQLIKVQSRRGEIKLALRRDEGTPQGGVFIPFAYVEAAANLLSNPELDLFGKIPGMKYCAVRLMHSGRLGTATFLELFAAAA
jgi:formate dehydrogenase major subunit